MCSAVAAVDSDSFVHPSSSNLSLVHNPTNHSSTTTKTQRCLDRAVLYPPENPIVCHYARPLNDTFVVGCCKDYDHCNRDLKPILHVRNTTGKRLATLKPSSPINPPLVFWAIRLTSSLAQYASEFYFYPNPLFFFYKNLTQLVFLLSSPTLLLQKSYPTFIGNFFPSQAVNLRCALDHFYFVYRVILFIFPNPRPKATLSVEFVFVNLARPAFCMIGNLVTGQLFVEYRGVGGYHTSLFQLNVAI